MEQTIQPEHVTIPDPKLQQAINEPKGVIRKNLKVWIFLGACAVVVSAGLISNWTKKESGHAATSQHVAPQPALQDNTDNNVQDLKNQLAAERQREAQAAAAQAAQANTAPTMMGGIPMQPGVCRLEFGCPGWTLHAWAAMSATRSLCATTGFPGRAAGTATGGQRTGTGV